MSNNKQSMKLYTEEQIINAMKADFIVNEEIDNLINKLTPIELPSDEEIKKEIKFDWLDPEDVAYLGGAIWMRNKLTNTKEK